MLGEVSSTCKFQIPDPTQIHQTSDVFEIPAHYPEPGICYE